MSEETPAAPAVSADAANSVAERAPTADPKTGAPESGSSEPRPDGNADKAPEGENKPAEPAETKVSETTGPAELTDANHEEGRAAAPVAADAVETNGTPVSAKKAASAKRKSTSGPSSAKKRKSQQRITHLDAQPGEYYLARLKSFPPWPAIICDEEMLPQTLLTTRPVTTKQADGTYKEPYADGGKRVYERTFPIMFLETNEFAWIPNTDLTPLDTESCKDVSEKGKNKHLVAAYKVASENHELQHFKSLLADHQRAVQQEVEEREAQAAAKAAAKAEKEEKKKKRKSLDVGEDAEDVEMGDADEDKKKSKSAKKRKKDADSDAETEKPPKTPKTTTKLKLTTPKDPAAADSGKKTGTLTKTSKAKKTSKTSSEEAAVETPKEAPKPVDPQEAKARKEKDVLFIRHKLQKGFISRDQAPKEEEMASMSSYISKLESQHSDLEVSIIRSTKINKVLKAIIKLNSIPKDEEFHFRRRSIDILAKWKNLLESDVATAGGEEPAKDQPKTNGVHKEEEGHGSEKNEADVEGTGEKPTKEEENEIGESKAQPVPNIDGEEKEKPQAPGPVKEEESKEVSTEKPAAEVAA